MQYIFEIYESSRIQISSRCFPPAVIFIRDALLRIPNFTFYSTKAAGDSWDRNKQLTVLIQRRKTLDAHFPRQRKLKIKIARFGRAVPWHLREFSIISTWISTDYSLNETVSVGICLTEKLRLRKYLHIWRRALSIRDFYFKFNLHMSAISK